jgi:hypothetical protein
MRLSLPPQAGRALTGKLKAGPSASLEMTVLGYAEGYRYNKRRPRRSAAATLRGKAGIAVRLGRVGEGGGLQIERADWLREGREGLAREWRLRERH